MYKFILLLGFFLIQSMVYSQQKIILEGRIVTDSVESSRINILNITRNTGTTNSDSGEFKIEVQEKDTLVFSSVQYEKVQIEISEENIKNKFLIVELTDKVIDLNEVIVNKIDLTGNLSKDIEKFKTYDLYKGIPTSKIPRLTPIGRQLFTARDGDIDPLLNRISGRMQMLEKANENEQLTMHVQKGIDVVENSFFTDILQIPNEEIINFVFYCARRPLYKELILNNNFLELIDLYKEMAPAFKKNREIKPKTFYGQ